MELILEFMSSHSWLTGLIIFSVPMWGGFVIIALRTLSTWRNEQDGGTRDQRLLMEILTAVKNSHVEVPDTVLQKYVGYIEEVYPSAEWREQREGYRAMLAGVATVVEATSKLKESIDRGLLCPYHQERKTDG